MRSRFFPIFIGFLLAWPAYSAERWREYTYPEDGFSASFPGKPVIVKRLSKTSQSPNRAVPERIYWVNEGGVIYSISVMDFTKAEADPDIAVGEVVSALTDLGRLAFDESIYTDSMHGRQRPGGLFGHQRLPDTVPFHEPLLTVRFTVSRS